MLKLAFHYFKYINGLNLGSSCVTRSSKQIYTLSFSATGYLIVLQARFFCYRVVEF